MYHCKLVAETLDSRGKWDGDHITRIADFPLPPFVGLCVGALVVERVLILQGDRDSGIEVQLSGIERRIAESWIKHGEWKFL